MFVLLTANCLLLTSAACATKPPALPSGPGSAYPEFARAYEEATAACRAVKTLTVSMAMSGKAGNAKLRGRIDAGFAAPGKARLEGIPPFGKPVFILVANGSRGTLVLTREDRVLTDARPDQIIDALAGVALGPDALRTIVSGCGFADGAPTRGEELRANGADWVAVHFAQSSAYLVRRDTGWQLAGAKRGPLTVTYANFESGRPTSIAIRASDGGRTTADLRLQLSDIATNTTLDPRTFDITPDLPAHPVPLTLEELRRAGPLGGS